MDRGAKSAKTTAAAKRPVARKSRAPGAAKIRELQTRLAEALEQQAATNEILRLMAASPGDVQPVLDAVAERAAHLCKAPFARVLLSDGDALHVLAHYADDGESPMSAVLVVLKRTSISGRAVLDSEVIHHADIVPLLDAEFSDARENVRRIGCRAVLAVPLMREGGGFGAIFLWRREPGLFAPDQVALVQTFARQAAIAIDNVRLFKEVEVRNRDLSEALEQQEATSEILRAIASSPTDIQPVLETVVHAAARFCGAPDVLIMRVDNGVLRGAAAVGPFADVLRSRSGSIDAVELPLTRGSVSGRAAVEHRSIHIHDLAAESEEEYPIGRELQRRYGHHTLVSVPLLRESVTIGVIVLFRTEVKPFSDRQLDLVRTFADQAVIAIENVRLFTELDNRNHDLTEALEQQTATSEILRVISQSQTDVQPVFDTIAQSALTLCRASAATMLTYDGELIHLASVANVKPEATGAIRKLFPRPPSHDTAGTRAILTRRVVVIPDVLEDPVYSIGSASHFTGFRGVMAVPLVREDEPIGAIAVGRPEPGPFSGKQIALLQTFADQAVIAIENVRLFNELGSRNRDLSEALEQQTATSEILRAISSSPTDVQPVFDIIAERAGKLCGAEVAVVSRFDGTTIELAAIHGLVPDGVKIIRSLYPMKLSAQTVTSRVIRGSNVVHIPDVFAEPSYELKDFARAAQYRAGLGVPIIRNRQVIGSIFVGRERPGLFADSQVELLKTFSEQAVIAIENVRLFTELDSRNHDLTEALEQQTATSDILRVISQSPTNVQPVFDTIAAAAMNLCSATAVNVFTFDGELVRLASLVNANPQYGEEMQRVFPRPPSRDTAVTRAVLLRNVVHIPDVLEEPDYAIGEHSILGGFRSVLAVPLMREDSPIGAIAVGRPETGQFPTKQVELLKTFAAQAVIAIENVRLFTELDARTMQLTQSVGELKALGEVGQAVSSTLDLETVLRTIVARATELSGVDGGAIYEYDEAKEQFYMHTADRYPAELVDVLRAKPIRKGEGALGRLAVVAEPVQIRNIAEDRTYRSRVREILLRLGYRSLLAIPLVREDHLLGGLVVNRKSAGEFAPQVIELLKTFATQSALAIQNARLFREIEDKGRQLEVASRHKSEFLANMSHELRTPLNAIIGFSEVLAERMFGEINDKQAEYLADILESGRHLLTLINDILDLSKIEAGRMELEPSDFSLPGAIDNALTLVRERAQRREIRLARSFDPRVGYVRADERKVKQVLLNLLSNALKFTPEGGQIDVEATVLDGMTRISVTDTGVGIASEDLEAVFEEFRQVGTAAKKVEGTGLGLAISRKFIELHGGRIWVTSKPGVGSTFAFTLPRAGRGAG